MFFLYLLRCDFFFFNMYGIFFFGKEWEFDMYKIVFILYSFIIFFNWHNFSMVANIASLPCRYVQDCFRILLRHSFFFYNRKLLWLIQLPPYNVRLKRKIFQYEQNNYQKKIPVETDETQKKFYALCGYFIPCTGLNPGFFIRVFSCFFTE